MKYDLAQLTRRTKKTRRKEIVLREVKVPATFAGDLYAGVYKPIVQAWAGAVLEIEAAYARALSELITDSPEQISSVVSQVESDLVRVLLTVRLRLERWAQRVEAFQRGRWRGAVLSATGVDIGTLIGPSDMRVPMSAAIEANVALVSSVSNQTRDRIAQEVFAGLRERKPAREVAKALREKVDMGRRRSLNVASDQLVKLSSALNDERRREAGLSTWEWISSHKAHFRPEHAARDGKRYDDDAKSGANKPPQDLPGMLPYCGCTSRAVLSMDDEF